MDQSSTLDYLQHQHNGYMTASFLEPEYADHPARTSPTLDRRSDRSYELVSSWNRTYLTKKTVKPMGNVVTPHPDTKHPVQTELYSLK